jgi:hypothetical protein
MAGKKTGGKKAGGKKSLPAAFLANIKKKGSKKK